MITNPHIAQTVHYLFEWVALATGLLVYRATRTHGRNAPLIAPGSFATVAGCLLGAAIGNKLAFLADDPNLWTGLASKPAVWLQGQSIVGALLGGWIGVEIGKRIAGNGSRTGDDYVAPILAGLIIGRIGCFLAGLHDGTYGLPTQLPWSVDFGDGIPRHPTQLYECLLALLALITWPRWRLPFSHTPGLAFRVFMLGYLLWRMAVDMLKPIPYAYTWGLSGLQWICIFGTLAILFGLSRDHWRTQDAQSQR